MLNNIFLLILLLLCTIASVRSQCPTSDFSANTTACIGENLNLQNTSLNAVSFIWDFCSGDFVNGPTGTVVDNNSLLNRVYSIQIVQHNQNWYGFGIGLFSNKLIRLNFGTNLENIPSFTDLGTIGGAFNGTFDIKIYNIQNNWFGFVANGSNNELVRLDFGAELTSSPSVINLGGFGLLDAPSHVALVEDGDNYYLFITNTNDIVRVNFGNSITNISPFASTISIANSNRLRSLSFEKDCDQWYAVLNSFSNAKFFKLQFDSGLGSNPIVSEITVTGLSFPATAKLFFENSTYYALIQSALGNVFLVDFGNSLSNTTNSTNLGDFGFSGEQYGFDLVHHNSTWKMFSSSITANNLQKIVFDNNCAVIEAISSEGEPLGITYDVDGTYNITLTSYDSDGNINHNTGAITISMDTAPTITTTSQNICLSNPINFTSTSDQTLSSQTWNFGDTNSSSDPNPSHAYASAGEYEVTLQVQSENGCNNFTKQLITIYDQPAPSFILPTGSICTNEEYTFTNNTVDNFDGNLTYEWQVEGEAIGTEKDLVYQFESAGVKEVKLIASIPGCSIEQVQSIPEVTEGAVPSFSYDANNTCLGDPILFTNTSSGASISEYAWDFGDTNASAELSPSNTYNTAGTYMVALQVTNAAGCTTNYQEEITIHSLPVAAFTADHSCTDKSTIFTDMSTVNGANIENWQWDFGDEASGGENVSSDETPSHTYSDAGTYDITLTAISTYGCEDSTEGVVEVFESPIADFSFDVQCVGNGTTFFDNSTPNVGGTIKSNVWVIDGEVYTDVNPTHTFEQPGTYDVTLTVKSDNACAEYITKSVEVTALPTVDFSWSSQCASTSIEFTDESMLLDDEVSNRFWTVNNENIGSDDTMNYTFDQPGVYVVGQKIYTSKGCIVDKSMAVEIYELPVASFDVSEEYSAVPATIQVENNSTNAMNYTWAFSDGSAVSTEESPSHTFSNIGTYDITLTIESPDGCFDQDTKQVHVVDPMIDLSIDDITSFNDNSQILFTMSNHGTLPIASVTANITFNSEISLQEQFTTNILPGQKSVVRTLDFSIPENAKIEYLCIALSPEGGDDLNIDDNVQCINISSDFQILNPFPNPVTSEQGVVIPVIGDKNDIINIGLMNAEGKQIFNQGFILPISGLNNVPVSLLLMQPGIYFIQVVSGKSTENFRIFVL